MASTNLKGGTDALFFLYDEEHLIEGGAKELVYKRI